MFQVNSTTPNKMFKLDIFYSNFDYIFACVFIRILDGLVNHIKYIISLIMCIDLK